MMDKFTTQFQSALAQAQSLAVTNDNQFIEPMHVLAALLPDQGHLLRLAGVDVNALNQAVQAKLKTLPQVSGAGGDVQISRQTGAILNLMEKQAQKNKDAYISSELFFQAALESKDQVADLLKQAGAAESKLAQAIQQVRGGESVQDQNAESTRQALEKYTIDLTARAESGKLDPVIGRDDEIRRAIQVLQRRTKNNPVLIGDPGVGKTAIVEGLALQIKQGKAPFYLANKKILSLDLGLLIAGTTFRGEFEARLKEVIAEAKQNPNLILFIDEIHNLVGAGNSIGGMDAANMLKPALSRGQIQVIGATTFEEYRKYIEKDAALERRFQPVVVNEPSVEETIAIIRGIKNNFETYHSIEITDAAICQAASLAKRYIIDRFLPDSAIDLIDETAARIRSKQMNTRLFKMLLNKETKLESVIKDKETLVVNDRFEDAIRLRNKEKQLQNEITGLKKQLTAYQKKHRTSMDEKEIQQTISSHTRIPTELLNADNINILKSVAEHLKQNIFGQDEAVQKINETLLRQFSGVGAPDRPLGSFLFVGPSGVGKTYTAKLLAQSIAAGNTESLIHINMSEFMERHTVSKLLGAPAGYVGYDDSADLMEKIRRNPYSVVLFDEIDKADPSVLNILLQIMEEGSINDSKGRKINFRNTIIILTSNIGTEELNQLSRLGFELSEDKIRIKESETKKIVMEELKEQLAPEFLNRLDHIIVFEPLLEEQIKKIIRHELEILSKRLAEKSISLNYPQSVIDFLTKNSIDPQQGARLIRKQIESRIEPLIAKKLLESSKNCFNLTIRQDNITIR